MAAKSMKEGSILLALESRPGLYPTYSSATEAMPVKSSISDLTEEFCLDVEEHEEENEEALELLLLLIPQTLTTAAYVRVPANGDRACGDGNRQSRATTRARLDGSKQVGHVPAKKQNSFGHRTIHASLVIAFNDVVDYRCPLKATFSRAASTN